MGLVLAIDPGTTESAWVLYDPTERRVLAHDKAPNDEVLDAVLHPGGSFCCRDPAERLPALAIEMIASYGMPVGREVFETCVWIGRFWQAWCGVDRQFVYRRDVKLHLCGTARAKDANVRTALVDLFGGKVAAIGSKKDPGPLYGISGDRWAALGVAVTWAQMRASADTEHPR